MTKNTLTKIIEQSQESINSNPRDYIGASIIGSDCTRQIWYEFNGYTGSSVPNKTKRTWEIGKKLESLVMDWLKNTDIRISDTWWDLESSKFDFFRGHIDCMWMELSGNEFVPYAIVEIKTAKDASFKIFVNKGLRAWSYQYYCQIQAYMGMSGIHSAYILVLNKDNSELSDELVTFDEEVYESLKDKAKRVYNYATEPPRINDSPYWFQCKLCKYNKECHK